MKIGKDEIGVMGIIGLILFMPGAFLTVYGFLNGIFSNRLLFFSGIVIWAIAYVIYYADLSEHQKKKQLSPPPPPPQ